jgi:hypothetical protein
MQGAEVKVDGQKMCQDLVNKSNFWEYIKDDPNLFHLEVKLNITVTGKGKNIRIYVGNMPMDFTRENSIIISESCNAFFDGTYNSDKKKYTLKKDWEDIFTHVK